MDQLRRDREERAKELAEAQDFKAKLMTVMGTVKQTQVPVNQPCPRLLNYNEYDPDVQEVDRALPRREQEVDPAHSFESSTSSRSGPTPKRNKTRRSLNSPLTQSTRAARKGLRGKSLGNPAVRPKLPLKDLSVNGQNAGSWSPTRIRRQKFQDQHAGIARAHSKENHTNSPEEDVGETSFGSDVFTSTNQQRFKGSEDQYSKDMYDETTVDF